MVVQRVREDRKETMEFQVKVSGGRRWKSRLHFLLRKTRSEKMNARIRKLWKGFKLKGKSRLMNSKRTNYYLMLQLIQRYDPDPASKAAAATVLASKLGADTGLKVYLGDESKPNAPAGKSNDVEIVQSAGLRNRKQARSGSPESAALDHSEGEMIHDVQLEGSSMNQHQQMVVNHYNPTGSSTLDGGWLARIAALLVGEDPTQSYALICGNCHMHNGLARKEDFTYVTYYCPHCNALNRPRQLDDHASGSGTPNIACTTVVADADLVKQDGGSTEERISASSSPVVAASATTEGDLIVSSTSSS